MTHLICQMLFDRPGHSSARDTLMDSSKSSRLGFVPEAICSLKGSISL